MRILNLQNTILVSLLVAGAAASAACSSSDATRPDASAGTTSTTGGTGNAAGSTATGGTGNSTTGGTSTSGGTSSVAGTTSGGGSGGAAGPSVCDGTGSRVLTLADSYIENFETITMGSTDATLAGAGWYSFNDLGPAGADAMDSTCGATCSGSGRFKMLRTAGMGAASTAFFGEYKGTGANVPPTPMAFGIGTEFNVGVNTAI